jgi:hypothetical protein
VPALVPPAWLVWLVVGAAASAVVPYFGWLYFASLVLYSAAIVCGAAWLGRGRPRAVAGRIPLVLAGIHAGFGWGFLREVGTRARYHRRHDRR